MGRFEQGRAGKKERKGEVGGEKGFQDKRFRSHNFKIHSSCEIKDLVETHICKIVYDTPIARINHLCRGLLYTWC